MDRSLFLKKDYCLLHRNEYSLEHKLKASKKEYKRYFQVKYLGE